MERDALKFDLCNYVSCVPPLSQVCHKHGKEAGRRGEGRGLVRIDDTILFTHALSLMEGATVSAANLLLLSTLIVYSQIQNKGAPFLKFIVLIVLSLLIVISYANLKQKCAVNT